MSNHITPELAEHAPAEYTVYMMARRELTSITTNCGYYILFLLLLYMLYGIEILIFILGQGLSGVTKIIK